MAERRTAGRIQQGPERSGLEKPRKEAGSLEMHPPRRGASAVPEASAVCSGEDAQWITAGGSQIV